MIHGFAGKDDCISFTVIYKLDNLIDFLSVFMYHPLREIVVRLDNFPEMVITGQSDRTITDSKFFLEDILVEVKGILYGAGSGFTCPDMENYLFHIVDVFITRNIHRCSPECNMRRSLIGRKWSAGELVRTTEYTEFAPARELLIAPVE
jgi:hypothetical protein